MGYAATIASIPWDPISVVVHLDTNSVITKPSAKVPHFDIDYKEFCPLSSRRNKKDADIIFIIIGPQFLIPPTDTDECRGIGRCEQQCNNTAGSFICTCRSGFQVNPTNQASCMGNQLSWQKN